VAAKGNFHSLRYGPPTAKIAAPNPP
jgi:hypothetical protein